jgi:hypothetical protein
VPDGASANVIGSEAICATEVDDFSSGEGGVECGTIEVYVCLLYWIFRNQNAEVLLVQNKLLARGRRIGWGRWTAIPRQQRLNVLVTKMMSVCVVRVE